MSAVRCPRRRPDVQEYELGDELLLYSPRAGTVITLDPAARTVWELCDGTRSVMEISLELEQGLDSVPKRLFEDVERTVNRFINERLAANVEPTVRPMKAPEGVDSAYHVGLDGSRVSITSSSARVRRGVRRRLGMMLDHPAGDLVAHFEIRPDGRDFLLLKNSRSVRIDRSLQHSLRHLEGELIQTLMIARPDLLWLHAGAAATQGKAIVLTGLSGVGKSTLVTHLCERGWSYLSDETVPIDLAAGHAIPFARTPIVRQPQSEHLSVDRLHELQRTEVDIEPESACSGPVAIGAFVLPVFKRSESPRLDRCSPTDAALALLQNCLSFQSQRELAVRGIVQLVREVPTFRLTFEDGGAAADVLIRAQENSYFD